MSVTEPNGYKMRLNAIYDRVNSGGHKKEVVEKSKALGTVGLLFDKH